MATVYLARDIRHDRNVALKVLKPELGAVLGAERFFSEIKVTANLQHPNLLPLFDSGQAGNLLYYVMPYVEGESLRDLLDRETQLPVEEAVRIAQLLASALDCAHSRGVVHRDLKPENILLQARQPMIADFGIALAVVNAGGARITQTGLSLGTPQYMSPEQATGDRSVDGKTDQYSLGAVTYEMLTGEPPHTGASSQAIIARLMTERPRTVRATRDSVPEPVDDAILRALAKVPADRFTTCGDFARAIGAGMTGARTAASAGVASGTPAAATVHTATGAPSKLRSAAIIGTVAAVAAIAAAVWFGAGRTNAPTALDYTRVFVADPAGASAGSGLEATAAAVNDAVIRGLGELAWIRTSSPAVGGGSADPIAAAKRVSAATVLTTTVLAAGDTAQLQFRLLETATGTVLRAIPTVRVPKNPSPGLLRTVVEPAIVGIGFITGPRLGTAALPSGELPDLDTFKIFDSAIQDWARPDTIARSRMFASFDTVVKRRPNFAQGRLWLAMGYVWFGGLARVSRGAALMDSAAAWASTGRAQFTPFEAAIADFALAGAVTGNEQALAAARRLTELVPRAPLGRTLATTLLDINRPREAIVLLKRLISEQPDSSARYLLLLSDAEHYVGDYPSSLKRCEAYRQLVPSDVDGIRCALVGLAAVGDTSAFNKIADEAAYAPQQDRLFGFAGDLLLAGGQELKAHGNSALGDRVLMRAQAWFDANKAASDRSFNIALRGAFTLATINRVDDALVALYALEKREPTDSRVRGFIGRMLAVKGDTAGAAKEIAWLRALPSPKLQGAPSYELAAIHANLGTAHWPEAVTLLETGLREGQGFSLRRRIHWFADWTALKDYPPFKKVMEPRG